MAVSILKEYISCLIERLLLESKWDDAIEKYPEFAQHLRFFKAEIEKPKYIPWLLKLLPAFKKAEPHTEWYMDFANAIKDFDKLATQNKIQVKDINQYDDESELMNAVKRAKAQISQTAQRKVSKKDIKKIYEDSKYLIIQPLTKEASVFYGKGTRWCISALKDNQFDNYVADGMSFIFVINKNTNDKDAISYDSEYGEIYDIKDERQRGTWFYNKYPKEVQDAINTAAGRIIVGVPSKEGYDALRTIARHRGLLLSEDFGERCVAAQNIIKAVWFLFRTETEEELGSRVYSTLEAAIVNIEPYFKSVQNDAENLLKELDNASPYVVRPNVKGLLKSSLDNVTEPNSASGATAYYAESLVKAVYNID